MSDVSSTGDQMLKVLAIVATDGPLSVSEVARLALINRTVAHRLLATLAKHRFILKQRNSYVLGPGAFELAALSKPSIVTEAKPVMQRLAQTIKETVVLHSLSGGHAIVQDQVVFDGHLVIANHAPGSKHPLTQGASGWAMLAYQDEKTIARSINSLAENQRNDAQKRLQAIRNKGYALSHDELQQGVVGLAVPIL